tara:strand:+ start:4299 stop:4514 length:216 start_codon:yes stop_codon:yes gene_type:complete
MNSVVNLQHTLRKLHKESEETKKTISRVLIKTPFVEWQHIHQSLYEFIAPSDIIDQVLGELRKLERTPSYI